MIRFAAVAAVAAFALAQPAAAEVRVSLVGKSDAQIQTEVAAAARTVCLEATARETFRRAAYDACLRDTVKATLTRI